MTQPERAANLPAHYNCLDTIYTTLQTMIADGVRQRTAPFHTPTLSYIEANAPITRNMVLRGIEWSTAALRLHTHVKSPKIAAMQANSAVSVHFYDAAQKVQVICSGNARIDTNSPQTLQAWDKLPPFSRRCYMIDTAPGTVWHEPSAGFAEHNISLDKVPTMADSERGKSNFAVINVHITRLDWLYLSFMGNRRAEFTLNAQGQCTAQQWLLP
jgi:pyridoxamine 5'-phosphate oxidase